MTATEAEGLLFGLPVRLMRLREAVASLRHLRQESDYPEQNYKDIHASKGRYSDPVSNYYVKCETLERFIQKLSRDTTPVVNLRNKLRRSKNDHDHQLYMILEMYYFDRSAVSMIAERLHISEKTITRRRSELVNMLTCQ